MNNRCCPLCNAELNTEPEIYAPNGSSIGKSYDCLYCHKFAISDELDEDRDHLIQGNEEKAAIVRYKLAMNSSGGICYLTTKNIVAFLTGEVPNPAAQLNNFILWLRELFDDRSL